MAIPIGAVAPAMLSRGGDCPKSGNGDSSKSESSKVESAKSCGEASKPGEALWYHE